VPSPSDQRHPWERAGCTPGAWFRLFDRLTADWIAAARAVRMLYLSPDDPGVKVEDPAEVRRRADFADDLHVDWRNAIDGEAPTIRSLLQRYRIDPRG
jgi:hypothetical protein